MFIIENEHQKPIVYIDQEKIRLLDADKFSIISDDEMEAKTKDGSRGNNQR